MEEFDTYRFRVCTRPTNGDARREMWFETLADAKQYAQACIDATCVEYLKDDGTWTVMWQDGEMIYTRPGFAVLVAYRSAKWNEAIALLNASKN